MKSKKYIAVIAVVATTVVGLSSFTINKELNTGTHLHETAQGAHCNYTVGCRCYGFYPSGPEVYKKSICKRCAHHKSYHK